ncbi:HAD family hydrolase [Aquiflexum lacus]|uniref:HAD family hydrolase n=1 Tax=Aquiflexum lacus TaxID=2483805 RepID=UPI00293BEAA5|nr:HAD family hydrolase [Aquiflexum lacus]
MEKKQGIRSDKLNPLPSWNNNDVKSAIINFVENATEEGNSNFIPESDRIACFDNDGTLWAEQPMYFQLIYAIDFIKKEAHKHPEWSKQEPFKSILQNDLEQALKGGNRALMEIIMASHAGISTAEFDKSVKNWLESRKHPKYNKPYNQLIYQPMIELLDYLRSHQFKCFIVSGGGVDFIRNFSEETYNIPKHQVIGSSLKVVYEIDSLGMPVLIKKAEINHIDDGLGKPVGVHQYIGKKPVFSAGNSDGDYELLAYTKSSKNENGFAIIIHHTDAEREFAYDRESHIGKLKRAMDDAPEKGWYLVDMAKDWNIIFEFNF